MSILVTGDFTGRYAIPLTIKQESDLEDMITYVEEKYLPELFGVALYDLFVLDLALPVAGEPTDPRFIKVFNSFNLQKNTKEVCKSEGIKEMLKGLTYFHYLRDIGPGPTTVGFKDSDSANSKNITSLQGAISSRYNQGIETYKVIQYYMCIEAPTDYPEFEGEDLDFQYNF